MYGKSASAGLATGLPDDGSLELDKPRISSASDSGSKDNRELVRD